MQLVINPPIPSLTLVAATDHSPLDRDQPTARMYLTSRPRSAAAKAFIATLAASMIESKIPCTTPNSEYHLALGAMVAELLRAASYAPPRACFRPLKTESFTGGAVGYRPFKQALADMRSHGFAKLEKGYSEWGTREGTVTRILFTPRLTHQLAASGITVANRFHHFDYQRAMEDIPPIQLRATTAKEWPRVFRGRKMRVDYACPTVTAHADQIRSINAYLGKQSVIDHEGVTLDIALRRIFNLGDQSGHGYNKGGRAYESYQSIKRKYREHITINGHRTIEVDISACFLTLLHFLLGHPFCATVDPYAGPDLPRDIIKAWVNLTIGHSNYHKRWPKETISKLEEKGYVDVPKRYPMTAVRKACLPHFPIVSEWVESSYSWADLFRAESQIMLDATQRLAEVHNIPALPMHDALRVSVQDSSMTVDVIKDEFLKHTGIQAIVDNPN